MFFVREKNMVKMGYDNSDFLFFVFCFLVIYQCHNQREDHQFQQRKQGEEHKDFSMKEINIL